MNTHALMSKRAIRKPSVAKQPFSRLTDGESHPVVVRQVSDVILAVLPEKDWTQEIGVNTSLWSLGLGYSWSEVSMETYPGSGVMACKYGCKVYENDETGERVLAHHGVYGCTK